MKTFFEIYKENIQVFSIIGLLLLWALTASAWAIKNVSSKRPVIIYSNVGTDPVAVDLEGLNKKSIATKDAIRENFLNKFVLVCENFDHRNLKERFVSTCSHMFSQKYLIKNKSPIRRLMLRANKIKLTQIAEPIKIEKLSPDIYIAKFIQTKAMRGEPLTSKTKAYKYKLTKSTPTINNPFGVVVDEISAISK
tara:strand:+ start:469 stop:1050 length:582 start_codon:yes stop_codon:yes gene_type:complete